MIDIVTYLNNMKASVVNWCWWSSRQGMYVMATEEQQHRCHIPFKPQLSLSNIPELAFKTVQTITCFANYTLHKNKTTDLRVANPPLHWHLPAAELRRLTLASKIKPQSVASLSNAFTDWSVDLMIQSVTAFLLSQCWVLLVYRLGCY